MFVRKLSYLSPNECYKKVELDIYENKSLNLVYIKNKGYSLFISNKIRDMFLIKTNLSPSDFKLDDNAGDKEEFINLVKSLLDEIYSDADIPEYEKQHHEFVFLKMMDSFNKDSYENIDVASELHETIEKGFQQLELSIILESTKNQSRDIGKSIDGIADSFNSFKTSYFGKKD